MRYDPEHRQWVKTETRTESRDVVVAAVSRADIGILGEAALALYPRIGASSVAIVGLGCGILAQFLHRKCRRLVCFEIEPEIAAWFPGAHPWCPVEIVVGDFRETLTEHFDFIVYDLGGDPPDALSQFGQVIVPG